MKTAQYNPETKEMIGPDGRPVTWTDSITLEEFKALQVAAYVMVGGGFLGRFYAEQPADAYIDTRCGKRPYKSTDIENVRQVLIAACVTLGFDPHHAPAMESFPGCWVF